MKVMFLGVRVVIRYSLVIIVELLHVLIVENLLVGFVVKDVNVTNVLVIMAYVVQLRSVGYVGRKILIVMMSMSLDVALW